MLVGALYSIVDQIFLGNGVGYIAIGATAVAFPIVTACMALALLCGVGGASNYNLESGKERHDKARQAAGNALFLLCTGGIAIMMAVLLFLEPLLRLCGATDRLMYYALNYVGITAYGMPFLIIVTGGAHLIRADKSPKYSMMCILSGAILNVILTPIFLFVFEWGIQGAAWSTVISQFVSASLVVIYFLKLQKTNLKLHHLIPKYPTITRVCSLGSAACINQASMLAVQIVLNNQLAKYGALSIYGAEVAVTCAGIIAKASMIFLGMTVGVSHACQPIWGFNYGAKNYKRVRETYKKAVFLCLSIGVTAFILFQLFPAQIIQVFGVTSNEGITFAVRYFRIFMFMTFINGLQLMSSGFFTSIGRAKLGIITSLTRQIVFLVPLIMFLPIRFGIEGILFAGPIADGGAAVVVVLIAAREMRKLNSEEITLKSNNYV
jgi:putative MATE family efflux protein